MDRTRAHYERFPFVQGGGRRVRHWQRRLRPFLPDAVVRGAVVLDAGCGSGEIACGLADRGARVVAVDLTSAATRRTRAASPAAVICQADVLRLPLPDRSVDHTVSIGVLHHTPDCFAGLCELARVTRPGGSIVVLLYARLTPYHTLYSMTAPLRRRVPVTALDRAPGWWWRVVRLVVAAQVGRRLGDDQLKALIADQVFTPVATFHPAREISRWADALGLVVYRRKKLFLHANLVEFRCTGTAR
ncbi:class I SAM-dependent methyltransferase [Amycolatopsis sp. NPDC059657]|uniref:class I SAM-dependent methyltransferase n=1 Tax=Amycolatopsis sp. NPDC059657 TaxID=3346899 RepID=UPI00366EF7EB